MDPLRTDLCNWRYQAVIGVGGIGSGRFFALNHNHTLGREESRSGHFLDQKDYCKLHIIAHYLKALLGPEFAAIPIGKVGQDETGARLLQEMREAGLETHLVAMCPQAQTLFSLCFLYPDGTGGNLTTDNSACDQVAPGDVIEAGPDFRRFSNAGIALAVPEVPLEAREKLLDMGTAHHFFRAASFTSEEMDTAVERQLLQKCDLLAMNLDEAARAAGLRTDAENTAAAVVTAAVTTAAEQIAHHNDRLVLSITAGCEGSWLWDGHTLHHRPAFPAEAVSTAGAGDAHLAGLLAGFAAGLGWDEAHELAALVAAVSVTSPHTIDKTIGRDTLRRFGQTQAVPISPCLESLLFPEDTSP